MVLQSNGPVLKGNKTSARRASSSTTRTAGAPVVNVSEEETKFAQYGNECDRHQVLGTGLTTVRAREEGRYRPGPRYIVFVRPGSDPIVLRSISRTGRRADQRLLTVQDVTQRRWSKTFTGS